MASAYFTRRSAGVGPGYPLRNFVLFFVLRLFSERCCSLSFLGFTLGRPPYTSLILGRLNILASYKIGGLTAMEGGDVYIQNRLFTSIRRPAGQGYL